jgi:cytochrome c peroxidase
MSGLFLRGVVAIGMLALLIAVDPQQGSAESRELEGFEWDLPAGFPVPLVPADNPISRPKVELGRHLFFDKKLSVDGTFACATCHKPELAFTDGRGQAVGVTGQQHPRGSMSLANVAYNATLTWADPNVDRLEEQMLTPMFSEKPIELGLSGMRQEVMERLRREPRYGPLFQRAFPEESDPFSFDAVVRAIASFERTLLSGSSPYDRYVYWGETDEFSQQARAGMRLFFSAELKCSICHSGFTFSGPVRYADGPPIHPEFHNTGLYNIGGTGAYPPGNQGLIEHTSDPEDMGHFRAPTLRNIALTAPYTHDGSVGSLGELMAHYSDGGRSFHIGELTEVGHDNPYKSEEVGGFEMTADELGQLVAFLQSLTDRDFIEDPRFRDPWVEH